MEDPLNSILRPTGMSIAIIINAVLMYLLLKRFKERKLFTKTKIATALVFITIILYDLVAIFRKSVLREYCAVNEPLGVCTFHLLRAALYYFFVIRLELTFSGSGAFSPKLINTLKIAIVSVYGLSAIYFVAISNYKVYDTEKRACYPSDQIMMAFYIVSAVYVICDLLLGVIICSLFFYRLYAVYALCKATMAVSDDSAVNVGTEATDYQFLHVIKKQGKLAFIAYISTLFLMYVGPGMGLKGFAFADGIVNGLCVYCTFKWNQNVYQYLCNCGGNKYVQCLFCFCCCCCNEIKSNDVELKVQGSRSEVKDGSSKAASVPTSDELTNQSSSDSAIQTIEAVIH